MVRALAKMTPDGVNTLREALLKNVISFLTKNSPPTLAHFKTVIRYNHAKGQKRMIRKSRKVCVVGS